MASASHALRSYVLLLRATRPLQLAREVHVFFITEANPVASDPSCSRRTTTSALLANAVVLPSAARHSASSHSSHAIAGP
eukprot:3670788-Rhodomonas_salina.1